MFQTIYVRDEGTGDEKTKFGFRIPKRKDQHSFFFVFTRPLAMFLYPAVSLPCFW
jgi:hypothetical protein